MSVYKGNKLIAGGSQALPLLSFMWADHQLNHPSWLRADTFSWQDGGVYQAAYSHLVDDIPQGPLAITTSDNTVYVRNSDDDVAGAAHPYCWAYNSTNYYTVSETPSANDSIFLTPTGKSKDSPLVSSVGRISATPTTETIAGITVQFYLSDDGHKICPASEESNVLSIYNATGVAWYYIIDTTNQRFKLPRTKFGFTGIRSGVGGYVEAGLPNIKGSMTRVWSPGSPSASGVISIVNSQYTGAGAYDGSVKPASWTMTVDASTGSSVYSDTATTVQPPATEMYLYFYVGQFTQTALENTAGVTTEVLNDKVDKGHQVVEYQEPTAENGYTWYRKYADGWVEQGGCNTQGTVNQRSTTLPVEMSNGNYQTLFTTISPNQSGGGSAVSAILGTTTTTGFAFVVRYGTNGVAGEQVFWQVSGMAA